MGAVDGVGWGEGSPAQLPRSRRELTAVMTHENPKRRVTGTWMHQRKFGIEIIVLFATGTQNTPKIQSLLTFPLLSLCFKPPASLV